MVTGLSVPGCVVELDGFVWRRPNLRAQSARVHGDRIRCPVDEEYDPNDRELGNAGRALVRAPATDEGMRGFADHYGPLWTDPKGIRVKDALDAQRRLRRVVHTWRALRAQLRGMALGATLFDAIDGDGRVIEEAAIRPAEAYERAERIIRRQVAAVFNAEAPHALLGLHTWVTLEERGAQLVPVILPASLIGYVWLFVARSLVLSVDRQPCRNIQCQAEKPPRGGKYVPCSARCSQHVIRHPEDDRNRLTLDAIHEETA